MLGRGMTRRRACGVPDRDNGRDTTVADMGRDTTRRDFATGPTARDPAPVYTARDAPFLPDDVGMSDGAAARWCGGPVVRRPYDVRLCPVMSGYVRLCPVMSGYVRLCPAARTLRLRISQRCHWRDCSA